MKNFNKFKRFIKYNIVKIILFFIFRGLKACIKYDNRVKSEIDNMKESYIFSIVASYIGPYLVFQKSGESIIKLDTQLYYKRDVSIIFKNIEIAMDVLFGRLSPAKSYARHGIIIDGDIRQAMPLVRCLNLVELYLFPSFISRKLFDNVPNKQVSSLKIYKYIFFNNERKDK